MEYSLLVLFLISFCWSSNVWAMMLPVKEPYKVVVGEGQYIFVMLPGYCVDEPGTLDMTDEEFAAFKKQKKESFRSL